MPARSTIIRNTIKDLITDLVVYDRKEDDDLKSGEIEEAIERREISIDQIMSTFRYWVTQNLPDDGTLTMKAEAQVDAVLKVVEENYPIKDRDVPRVRKLMVEAVLAVKPAKVKK